MSQLPHNKIAGCNYCLSYRSKQEEEKINREYRQAKKHEEKQRKESEAEASKEGT